MSPDLDLPAAFLRERREEESFAGSLSKTLDLPPVKPMWCVHRAHSPGGPRGGLHAYIASQPDDRSHFRLSHGTLIWYGTAFNSLAGFPSRRS